MVELVVALTVSSVFAVLLAATFRVAWQGFDLTSDAVAETVSANSLAVYLPPDIHGSLDATASASGAGISCEGVANPRLELLGAAGSSIVYGVDRVGDEWVLERHECVADTSTGSVAVARGMHDLGAVEADRTSDDGEYRGVTLTINGPNGANDPATLIVSGSTRS